MTRREMRKWLPRIGACCVVAVLLAAGSQTARAQDKPGGDNQHRIRGLIGQLASRNRAPKEGDGENKIPSGYGRQSQQRVLDAWKALLDEGPAAFALLIASLDDKRYSCTLRGGSGDVNATVGGVCHCIISRQIEVYEDVIDRPFIGAGPPVYLAAKDLRSWWREKQHTSLRDLQIEGAEHALRALKNPTEQEMRARERTPDAKERQEQNIRNLEALLERLKASRQPILPKTIEGGLGMIGLPGRDGQFDCSHPYEGKQQPAAGK